MNSICVTKYTLVKQTCFVLDQNKPSYKIFEQYSSTVILTAVLHWSHLVVNYGFFDGGEQWLKSRLGLVVVSPLVEVDQQNINHV